MNVSQVFTLAMIALALGFGYVVVRGAWKVMK